MSNLIYEKLTYSLNGLAYQIDNDLGFGYREKIYADAFETLLKEKDIKYRREVYAPIIFQGKVIAKRFFDFLIEDKIIIEIKRGDLKYKQTFVQLLEYLTQNNLKLGLIIRFTRDGVKIKRVPNFKIK